MSIYVAHVIGHCRSLWPCMMQNCSFHACLVVRCTHVLVIGVVVAVLQRCGRTPMCQITEARAQALIIIIIDILLHAVRRSPCVQTSLLVMSTVIAPSARDCIDMATHFTISNMQSIQRATTNRNLMLKLTNICKRQLSAVRRSPCDETAQTLKNLLGNINPCCATQ